MRIVPLVRTKLAPAKVPPPTADGTVALFETLRRTIRFPGENAPARWSVHEVMGRTSNDDRSDTMNPNNDAYAADQENRYGSGDDGSDDSSPSVSPASPTKRVPQRHPLDDLADPGLGPPDRYRTLDLDALRWGFETVLATPESEERDRKAAVVEVLRMSAAIFGVAAEAANRQCLGGHVLTGEGWVEIVFGDGRSLRMEEVPEHGFLAVVGSDTKPFGFSRRAWLPVVEKHSRHHGEPSTFELNMSRSTYEHDKYFRVVTSPLQKIVQAILEGQLVPGLADHRKKIQESKRHLERKSSYDSSLDSKRSINEAQERIAAIKAKLPPGVVNDSWEDAWSPDEKTGDSGS